MQHTTLSQSRHLIGKAASCALAGVLALSLCPGIGAPARAYGVTAAEMQAEAEAALANLNAMQETLDRLSAEYGEALAAQEEAESNRDAAEARMAEINGQIDVLQDRLGERAREMYRSGNVSFVEILLGARSFEEFATSWDMLNKHLGVAQMPIVSSTGWNMVHGHTPDGVRQDEEGLQTMHNLGHNMAWMLKCIEAGKAAGIAMPEAETRIWTNFVR